MFFIMHGITSSVSGQIEFDSLLANKISAFPETLATFNCLLIFCEGWIENTIAYSQIIQYILTHFTTICYLKIKFNIDKIFLCI